MSTFLLALLVTLKIAAFLMLGLAFFVLCLAIFDYIMRLRRRGADNYRGLTPPRERPPAAQNVVNVVPFHRTYTEEELEAVTLNIEEYLRRKGKR